MYVCVRQNGLCMCVCMCVCVCACMYALKWDIYMGTPEALTHRCAYIHTHVYTYIGTSKALTGMRPPLKIHSQSVRYIYVCMYVCRYVDMYVYIDRKRKENFMSIPEALVCMQLPQEIWTRLVVCIWTRLVVCVCADVHVFDVNTRIHRAYLKLLYACNCLK